MTKLAVLQIERRQLGRQRRRLFTRSKNFIDGSI